MADCPTCWAISPLNPTELAFTVPLSPNWISPFRCAGANLIGKGACIMSAEMNAHVLNLLETYRERERKIALLRYELEHPAHVSSQEMVEAMSLRRGDGSSLSGGHVSDKTLYIALNYQEKLEQVNLDVAREIAVQLVELEQQQKRLRYYVSLLDEQKRMVIQLAYFDRLPWEAIAEKLEVSLRTAHKIKNKALGRLTEMYLFTEDYI